MKNWIGRKASRTGCCCISTNGRNSTRRRLPAATRSAPLEHAADVNRFIDLLLTAARTAPVAVVATVRADFYDPLIGHQEIKSLLPTRQVLLGTMLRSELEHTIVEPAKKVGLTFDPPSLVQRILDEAGEDEGMLPLLQYALKETWARREGNRLTGDSYTRSGGVREAIRITAERTFDALSPSRSAGGPPAVPAAGDARRGPGGYPGSRGHAGRTRRSARSSSNSPPRGHGCW